MKKVRWREGNRCAERGKRRVRGEGREAEGGE